VKALPAVPGDRPGQLPAMEVGIAASGKPGMHNLADANILLKFRRFS
jgi:hypothetical protein